MSFPTYDVDTDSRPATGQLNKLFVYGIFLGQGQRDSYGMTNARYATVADYVTVGSYIVQAVYTPDCGVALTGLLVDIDPKCWEKTDRLEGGYDRIKIKTENGTEAWMYVQPSASRTSERSY